MIMDYIFKEWVKDRIKLLGYALWYIFVLCILVFMSCQLWVIYDMLAENLLR